MKPTLKNKKKKNSNPFRTSTRKEKSTSISPEPKLGPNWSSQETKVLLTILLGCQDSLRKIENATNSVSKASFWRKIAAEVKRKDMVVPPLIPTKIPTLVCLLVSRTLGKVISIYILVAF